MTGVPVFRAFGCASTSGNAGFGGYARGQRTVAARRAPSDRVEAEFTVPA